MRKFLISGVALVALAGCGIFTGNPAVDFSPTTIQANIATFNAWAPKIVVDANADVSALAAAGLPAVCTAVGVLDADLDTAALVSSKVAAVQVQADQVAAAFTKSPACTNAASITNIASAVATGVNTAAQVQAALKSDPAVVTAAPPAAMPALVPTPTAP